MLDLFSLHLPQKGRKFQLFQDVILSHDWIYGFLRLKVAELVWYIHIFQLLDIEQV